MKKKLTAYQLNLIRLSRQISRMEKRGYIFGDNIREELKGMTSEQLAKIDTDWLYTQSQYVDRETGEVLTVPGTEGRERENRERSRKSAITRHRRNLPEYDDTILSNFEADFFDWLNSPTETMQQRPPRKGRKKSTVVGRNPKAIEAEENAKTMIRAIYDRAVAEDRHGLAIRIDLNSDKIFDIIVRKMPSSDAETIRNAGNEIAEIIKGKYVTMLERTAIEDDEEYYEDYEE